MSTTTRKCAEVEARCVCGEPEGHVEQGQPIHKCMDHEVCRGEWKIEDGVFVPVVFPGGLSLREALRAQAEFAFLKGLFEEEQP